MEIILPDGSKKILEEGATVYDVAASIGTSLAKAALAGKINGELVDVTAQVTDGATIEIITNKSPEALSIMRHSCAHIRLRPFRSCSLVPRLRLALPPTMGISMTSSCQRISLQTILQPLKRRWLRL